MPSNPAFSQSSHYTKSTHSLASSAQTNKTIQQEYQEYKVKKQLGSWHIGPGKLPFKLAIVFVVIGFLLLGTGIGITAAWLEGRLILDDKQSFIGPLILILGLVCFGVAGWFFYDARRKSMKARKQLTYKSTGGSGVKIVDRKVKKAQSEDNLKSGTYSSRAVGSTADNTLRSGFSASVHSSRHSVASKKSLPSLDGRDRDHDTRSQRSRVSSTGERHERY